MSKSLIKNKKNLHLRRELPYHLMLIPAVLFTVIFSYIPMAGIIIAFKKYSFKLGFFKSPNVGLTYFKRFFSDTSLPTIIGNSFALGVLNLVFGTSAAILFALLLNELTGLRFKRFIQTVSYFPHFISYVTVVVILQAFLTSDGLLNQFLLSVGLADKAILFLGEPKYYWALVTLTAVWKETGWGAIIYISAITGIDQSMYESAKIDGAGRWKCMWNITLPSILPTISLMLILAVGGILSVGFDPAMLLANSLTMPKARVLSYYVYTTGIVSGDFSYSTALSLVTSLFSATFMLIGNLISKKMTGEGIL